MRFLRTFLYAAWIAVFGIVAVGEAQTVAPPPPTELVETAEPV